MTSVVFPAPLAPTTATRLLRRHITRTSERVGDAAPG